MIRSDQKCLTLNIIYLYLPLSAFSVYLYFPFSPFISPFLFLSSSFPFLHIVPDAPSCPHSTVPCPQLSDLIKRQLTARSSSLLPDPDPSLKSRFLAFPKKITPTRKLFLSQKSLTNIVFQISLPRRNACFLKFPQIWNLLTENGLGVYVLVRMRGEEIEFKAEENRPAPRLAPCTRVSFGFWSSSTFCLMWNVFVWIAKYICSNYMLHPRLQPLVVFNLQRYI